MSDTPILLPEVVTREVIQSVVGELVSTDKIIILDFKKVKYVASSGVALLIRISRKQPELKIRIINLNSEIKALMQFLGLRKRFH